jgi:hypothetical protein
MAMKVVPAAIESAASQAQLTRNAEADIEDIKRYLADYTGGIEFVYRAPFREYGEGFVVAWTSIPRMTYEYFRAPSKIVGSPVAWWVSRKIGVYVLDKKYFPTVESIKSAPNLALLDINTVKYHDGDKIVELRAAFILIRG